MSIAVLMLMLAAPNFQIALQNSRLRSTTSDFFAAVNLARTEAIKRSANVFLCRTADPLDLNNDGVACGEGQTSTHVWHDGWLIYAAPLNYFGGENHYQDITDAELIAVGAPARSGVTIRSNNEGDQWLSFNKDGSLLESGAPEFAFCDARRGAGDINRYIQIPLLGRPNFLAASTCCDPRDSGNPDC